jgi:sulfate transport system permease protein
VLPGFGPAFSLVILYLGLIVLIPLAALVARPWEHGISGFIETVTEPRVLAALRLSFGAALLASVVSAVMGLVAAWALTRYEFPFRGLLDAAIDLPFALPTAVAGIALASLYSANGWIGSVIEPLGLKIAYTPTGIFVALLVVGLPFVVRSVQPVLADFDVEAEEAAMTLGARPVQTAFRVILPALLPALLSGFSLAFARAVGEYGSVIFIAGNMPMKSEIAPLLIITKLEQFNYAGAASIGLAMLVLSFISLVIINRLQLALGKRGA